MSRRFVLWGGLLVVLVLAAFFLFGSSSKKEADQTPQNPPTSQTPVNLENIPVSGKVRGASDAPVTVEVFSDFNCPHCATSALKTEPNVLGPYMAKGQVRLQFRHFLVQGIQSYNAAIAAECASRQNKFWPFHDQLFKEQDPYRSTEASDEEQQAFRQVMEGIAEQLNLDMAAYRTCVSNEETKGEVLADQNLGTERKVTGTPTFFINGRKVENDETTIVSTIEEELKARK